MKTRKKIVAMLLTLLVVCVLGSIFLTTLTTQSEDDSYRKIFNEKIEKWKEACRNNSKISLYSYSGPYIKTKEFGEIVELGIEYLPYMEEYIEDNNDIYASALVVAVHLNAKTYIDDESYSSKREWIEEWKKFKNQLPDRVEKIIKEMNETNDPEKLNELKKDMAENGVLVLPFILEDIKDGNENLADVVRIIFSSESRFCEGLKEVSKLHGDNYYEENIQNILSVDTSIPTDNDKDKWKKWINDFEKKNEKIKSLLKQ